MTPRAQRSRAEQWKYAMAKFLILHMKWSIIKGRLWCVKGVSMIFKATAEDGIIKNTQVIQTKAGKERRENRRQGEYIQSQSQDELGPSQNSVHGRS